MSFTTKVIEELATNAVKKSILTADYLDQFISENDKEPTWDGFVYIYNDVKKKRKDFRGRVAVQIKGTVQDKIEHEKISFPVDVIDLRNFLSDGGAIYFVVYISTDGQQGKIYYATLSPVKISVYLDVCKEQETKNIELKPFPIDSNTKSTIFLNFCIDSKKQSSFSPAEMLDDLNKYKDLTAITMSITGFGFERNDPLRAFLENEIYLYAQRGNSDIQIPVKEVLEALEISHKENQVISVAGKEYYHSYQVIRSKGIIQVIVGKSLTITVNEETKFAQIDYKTSSSMKSRIVDSMFCFDALENKGFMLGRFFIPFEFNKDTFEKFNVDKEKSLIDYLRKVQHLFALLNVTKDIDVEKMTANEWREINSLMIAFLDKKPVINVKPNLPTLFRLKIQNIILLLIFKKDNTVEGQYRIYDFFSHYYMIGYDVPDSDEKYFTSIYSIMRVEDYIDIDNIDYEQILPSYQVLAEINPQIYIYANLDMLNILSAYDKTNNQELLRVAEKMADWIYENGRESFDKDIALLNVLQIARRQRELNLDEIQKLCDLVENGNTREDIKVGTYLLLGNQAAAQVHLNKLSEQEQDDFKEYPIFKFWKVNREETHNG